MPHPQDKRPEFTPADQAGPTLDSGQDLSDALCEQVRQAHRERTPLVIQGGGTKAFYGRRVAAERRLALGEHRGIVHYDPVELVITVRAGTPLAELESALAASGQRLPFEPPHFGDAATVGGMVACGLSGPRRPWSGAVRDFVLGTRVITHDGKLLRFGGEVMKNVAGYDLSRLMVGAQGTLGVLAEVSFKVLPLPPASACLRLEMDEARALEHLRAWGREPLPLSGAAFAEGVLHVRLEGGEGSVASTRERLGGDTDAATFWEDLREQRLAFFSPHDPRPLWRLSLPARARRPALSGDWLCDWAGAQQWLRSDEPAAHVHETSIAAGGHATRFGPAPDESSIDGASPFSPLPKVLARYHQQLKTRLDPHAIFNPGRLYADW